MMAASFRVMPQVRSVDTSENSPFYWNVPQAELNDSGGLWRVGKSLEAFAKVAQMASQRSLGKLSPDRECKGAER